MITRSDKKDLESSNRRLEGSNRRLTRELEDLAAELRASKHAQQMSGDQIDDLSAAERKLNRQNALLRDDLEREKHKSSHLRSSKQSALEAVLEAVSCHAGSLEERLHEKRGVSTGDDEDVSKRQRFAPDDAAEDDTLTEKLEIEKIKNH